MSNIIKGLLALGLVAVVSACAQQAQDEYVVVDPQPITVEPVSDGKYGGKY
jgi:hypothetical protein